MRNEDSWSPGIVPIVRVAGAIGGFDSDLKRICSHEKGFPSRFEGSELVGQSDLYLIGYALTPPVLGLGCQATADC